MVGLSGYNAYMGMQGMGYSAYAAGASASVQGAGAAQGGHAIKNPGESTQVQAGKKVSPAECETCANRKYQDGSDESDVSFQSPTHIDPSAAAGAVMSHEQEHVANAYEKAAKGGGKVMQASVQIHTATCPECGRVYVSGGTTTTQIKYPGEEDSPYQKARKAQDAANLHQGMYLNAAV